MIRQCKTFLIVFHFIVSIYKVLIYLKKNAIQAIRLLVTDRKIKYFAANKRSSKIAAKELGYECAIKTFHSNILCMDGFLFTFIFYLLKYLIICFFEVYSAHNFQKSHFMKWYTNRTCIMR